jgi:hypothetical protein
VTFDEQLQRALETFTGRLREEVGRQVRVVGDETAAAIRADHLSADPAVATSRLADGIRAISKAQSLGDVLDTLVRCAGDEAPRVGVLLVQGDRLHGWRDSSFDAGKPLDIARGDAGIVAEAIETATVASSGTDGGGAAPAFAQLPSGRTCMAAPIAIAEQVVAVLYADAGLERGLREDGSGVNPPEDRPVNRDALEILTRHAAQRLEALTAMKAARSLAPKSELTRGKSDEQVDEHAAARRYARLLVSEIKLYHEPQVLEGRRERDLATRLGGEIARVRTLYEQRVPLEVRQSTDYVHEELVRTLADGDASLLEAKT